MKLEGAPLLALVNVALILAQVAFGGFHVLGKYALSYCDPVVFSLYREVTAGPLLCIIALIFERAAPKPKDLWRFLILGTTGVFGNQLLFILGLKYTSAVQASIMQQCIPVFTALIAICIKSEKATALKLIGIACAAIGACVMSNITQLEFKSSQALGFLCLLVQTLCMAIYYNFQKPVLKLYPPISVTGWGYIIGSIEMGITAVFWVNPYSKFEAVTDDRVYIPLLYATFVATMFTYVCLSWGNKYAPASMVAAYSSLQPLTAGLLAYIFLKEPIFWYELLGGLVIICGLALVTYSRVRENKEQKRIEEEQKMIEEQKSFYQNGNQYIVHEYHFKNVGE